MPLPRPRRPRTGWAPVGLGLAVLLTAGSATAVAVSGVDARPARAAVRTAAASPVPVAAPAEVPPAALPTGSPAPVPSPSGPAAPAVRPLRAAVQPDLLVEVPGGLSAADLQALAAVRGVTALTALDLAPVRLSGGTGRAAGVDPSAFRAFTPRDTAASDPLWAAVARGELVTSYGLQRERRLTLGRTLAVAGTGQASLRVGAVAALGVPGVDLVVDRSTARRLGATRSGGVLLAAPSRDLLPLRRAVLAVTGPGATVTELRPRRVVTSARPSTYRELYMASARYCPGLSWTVLAAIGQIESGHGRNAGPSSAGALGPMQFLPSTWEDYGVDGDGDGRADITDPLDAVPAAALYLCRNGAGTGAQGLYDAVFAYNHADWYVREVLGLAARYR